MNKLSMKEAVEWRVKVALVNRRAHARF